MTKGSRVAIFIVILILFIGLAIGIYIYIINEDAKKAAGGEYQAPPACTNGGQTSPANPGGSICSPVRNTCPDGQIPNPCVSGEEVSMCVATSSITCT